MSNRREVVAGPCSVPECDGTVRSVAGGSLQCDTCGTTLSRSTAGVSGGGDDE